MINEAVFALQEGLATAVDIDSGPTLGAIHPIGPLALADLIGLDTMLSVMDVFDQGLNDPKYRPAPASQGNGSCGVPRSKERTRILLVRLSAPGGTTESHSTPYDHRRKRDLLDVSAGARETTLRATPITLQRFVFVPFSIKRMSCDFE